MRDRALECVQLLISFEMGTAPQGIFISYPMPQLNEEQIHERQLREELLSALNHDLRSPLGAIGIFCEILQLNAAELSDNQRQSLAMIQEANAKALRILDDAAEVSGIYKGTVQLRLDATEFDPMVQEVVAETAEALRPKGISLVVDGATTSRLHLDKEKTLHLLRRILEEAAGYSGRGGTVQLMLADVSGGAELRLHAQPQSDPEGVAASKRPGSGSVKGRLGVRKPTESPYSLVACEKVAALMGGNFTWECNPHFSARLQLPASSS